jgi:hypothetical protein
MQKQKRVKKQFKRLLILFMVLILNFVAFKSFSYMSSQQQGVLESTTGAVTDASNHLANDYGLSGIFIVFLIGLTIAMGFTIKKLVIAFIESNGKFIEIESKQTGLMEDMKGLMNKINDKIK